MTDNLNPLAEGMQELKQPMDASPATVHEAEKAGWRFARHLDFIMQEYEAAITELSDAQFEFDKKKSEELKNVSGKNADEREANLFPLMEVERRRVDAAEVALEQLKTWRYGREKQLSWAQSALGFLRAERDAAGRGS